jgi:hypothetical protein
MLERNSNKDPTRGFSVKDASVWSKKDIFEVAGEKGFGDLGAVLAQKTGGLPPDTVAPLVIILCGGIVEVIPLLLDGVPDQLTDNDDWEAEFRRAILG